MEDKDHLQFLL